MVAAASEVSKPSTKDDTLLTREFAFGYRFALLKGFTVPDSPLLSFPTELLLLVLRIMAGTVSEPLRTSKKNDLDGM